MIASQGSGNSIAIESGCLFTDVAASGEGLAWTFGQRLLQQAEQSCILEAQRIRLKGPGATHEKGMAGMGSRKGMKAIIQINVVRD